MGGGEPFTSYWNRCGLLLDTRVFPSNTAYLILLLSSPAPDGLPRLWDERITLSKHLKHLEVLWGWGWGAFNFLLSKTWLFKDFFPLGKWEFYFQYIVPPPHCVVALSPDTRCGQASFVMRAAWLAQRAAFSSSPLPGTSSWFSAGA